MNMRIETSRMIIRDLASANLYDYDHWKKLGEGTDDLRTDQNKTAY